MIRPTWTVTPIPRAEQPPLSDSAVPALEVLLGPGAAALLAEIAATRGAELGASFARRQVRYRLGRSVIVEFTVETTREGQPHRDILTVASGLPDPPPSSNGVYEGVTYHWWWFPDDPYLPGLALIGDRGALSDVLAQIGVREPLDRLRTRAYRASRRAVVEVTAGRKRVFLKIVTPDRARRLHDIHRELAGRLPVPTSHGVSDAHGVVVLGALAGEPLRGALTADWWHDEGAVASLVGRFGALSPDAYERATTPRRRLRGFRPLFEKIAPEGLEIIDELTDDRRLEPQLAVTIHGDFHSGQILVDRGAHGALGLVDLDTIGVGDPIADRASMLGQLAVLAAHDRRYEPALAPMHVALGRVDEPDRLAAWVANHVIGLATGPFRAQEDAWRDATRQRLELARSILDGGYETLLG